MIPKKGGLEILRDLLTIINGAIEDFNDKVEACVGDIAKHITPRGSTQGQNESHACLTPSVGAHAAPPRKVSMKSMIVQESSAPTGWGTWKKQVD